jgi:protein-disulfide isomerase
MSINQKELLEERRAQRRKQKRLTILMVVLGAGLIISAALLLLSRTNQVDLTLNEIVRPDLEQPPLADGAAMGDPEAPVKIVNYSDFGCSYCADFAQTTEKQLAESYVASGDVYFEFRSVGPLLGAPVSVQAAEAAYCAGDQNALYPYKDLIFANQRQLFINIEADIAPTLVTFAQLLELDEEQFADCLESGKYSDRVAQDEVDARQAGVQGTPSFLVNGELLRGNQPFANFQQIIQQELAAE